MEVVTQLLVVVILWMNDGSYKTNVTPVDECPPEEVIGQYLEGGRQAEMYKSWVAYCTPAEFGVREELDT